MSVPHASELLAKDAPVDALSRTILEFIAWFDDAFALPTVNLNYVAVGTFVILLTVRLTIKKYRGVDWYALLHALVSGYGALLAVYLDTYAAESLTGLPEPLRSCQCHGPLTSLHRVLPAITMGYSIFDFLDGLTLGLDFALHGFFTTAVTVFFVQFHAPQVLTPMLLMEISTIHLTLIRADFLSDTLQAVNQGCFAVLFFTFRIVVCPYVWGKLMLTMIQEKDNETYCFHTVVLPFAFVCGMFFHCLNSYWFYKIVRKVQRKMSGEEGVKSHNDLTDKEKKDLGLVLDDEKKATKQKQT